MAKRFQGTGPEQFDIAAVRNGVVHIGSRGIDSIRQAELTPGMFGQMGSAAFLPLTPIQPLTFRVTLNHARLLVGFTAAALHQLITAGVRAGFQGA